MLFCTRFYRSCSPQILTQVRNSYQINSLLSRRLSGVCSPKFGIAVQVRFMIATIP